MNASTSSTSSFSLMVGLLLFRCVICIFSMPQCYPLFRTISVKEQYLLSAELRYDAESSMCTGHGIMMDAAEFLLRV